MVERYILLIFTLVAVLHLMLEILHLLMIKKWKYSSQFKRTNWVWDLFYFNPDDPRILIPKRIEWLGWTLNYAHSFSWIITGVIIFNIIITIILVFAK